MPPLEGSTCATQSDMLQGGGGGEGEGWGGMGGNPATCSEKREKGNKTKQNTPTHVAPPSLANPPLNCPRRAPLPQSIDLCGNAPGKGVSREGKAEQYAEEEPPPHLAMTVPYCG